MASDDRKKHDPDRADAGAVPAATAGVRSVSGRDAVPGADSAGDAMAEPASSTASVSDQDAAQSSALPPKTYKIPISALVLIHSIDGQVLVLQRTDRPDYWQSVTGSLDAVDEDPMLAARRELQEETGFVPEDGRLWALDIQNRYEIYAHWRHRYAPGVTHNTEHVFAYALPEAREPRLSPREHLSFTWLPWHEAAKRCFSPNNAEMIRVLARRQGWAG